jgi:hypothetical protein
MTGCRSDVYHILYNIHNEEREERTMRERFEALMRQAVEPEIHSKILLRAAELVAMGWTTGAGARNERVRGTSPVAISWCLTGAVLRALFEVVGIDGYQGRDACLRDSVNFWWTLMKPVHRALAERGFRDHIVEWNDRWCGGPVEAEALLREAAATVSDARP